MIKKIFIYLLVFLSLFSLGFSILNDSIGYWALEDLTDSSGNNISLTNYGAIFTTAGKINGTYGLDGINDYLESDDLTISLTSSVSLWFKTTLTGSSKFMLGNAESGTDKVWTIYQAGTDNLVDRKSVV